jgi:hypothetical protein
MPLAEIAIVTALLLAGASPSASECPPARACVTFDGNVERGARFERPFGPGLTFTLEPADLGWSVTVRDERPQENIARITPPFHFVPNPRDIHGWHFRNAANTGPNDGAVNAPQLEREFCFTPEVGRPGESRRSVSPRDVGRGQLTIGRHELGNLNPGQTARFERMQFRVFLSWPEGWAQQRGPWPSWPARGGCGDDEVAGEQDVRKLILDLESNDRATALKAFERLEAFGPDESRFVPLLTAALEEDCRRTARAMTSDPVAIALGHMGKDAEGAVAILLRCRRRAHAPSAYLGALANIAKTLDRVPPSVTAALLGDDLLQRADAIEFVTSMGPAAKAAAPLIVRILEDEKLFREPNYDLRGTAIYALASIGPDAVAGVPVLIKMFRESRDVVEQSNLAIVLGKIGPPAADAVPILKAALRSQNEDLPRFSAKALTAIGTREALAAVQEYEQRRKD